MTIPNNSEPSVLDYLKGRLFPRRNPQIEIPEPPSVLAGESSKIAQISKKDKKHWENKRFFWLLFVIIFLAVIGQKLLEPPTPSVSISLVFYSCAIILIIWNWFRGRFAVDFYPTDEAQPVPQPFRPIFLAISVGVGFFAFVLFNDNQFTEINVILWVVSAISMLITFSPPIQWSGIPGALKRIFQTFFQSGLRLVVTPWSLLLFLAFILVFFFRFYRLNELPMEMISDQAEKLLDISDVLNGKFSIFFPRNTGREAYQMYLSAAISLIFGTGLSFLTLKIGTAIMGLVTAIYMYFLGKETGNRWVGLFAFLLCGIGYWPNVISRIGLRFTLYSAFTAPALYYFFKGLRRKRWSDLVLCGIFVGIGLHGYSPFRVVPVLLVIGIILYLLHSWKTDRKKFAVLGLVVIGFAALIIFLPLMRYMVDQPEMFAYRALTRAGSLERPLPGPAWQIFFNNLWRACIMFFYDNGTIWVHSIPIRPALDVVSAALFLIGLVVSVLRYIKQRDWRIPFLIFSIPFLMLPSILSLAFPDENPCLNRTAGALVPVFLIAAFGMDTLVRNIRNQASGWRGWFAAGSVGGLLLLTSVMQNYILVFDQFDKNYINNALNTSQIGAVIRQFTAVYGDSDSAYVVGYPYWVDTRLVGINAGYPTKDFAIWPDKFQETLANKRAKLFILNMEDTQDRDMLRQLYPDYYETVYQGWVPTKNFIGFLVPPSVNSLEEVGITAP
ncbi:MAG: glycosyltransferase family 39 protein [Leptolinea sp.]